MKGESLGCADLKVSRVGHEPHSSELGRNGRLGMERKREEEEEEGNRAFSSSPWVSPQVSEDLVFQSLEQVTYVLDFLVLISNHWFVPPVAGVDDAVCTELKMLGLVLTFQSCSAGSGLLGGGSLCFSGEHKRKCQFH